MTVGPVQIDDYLGTQDKRAGKLLTREESMARLRLKPAHFSKIVNGKVKGLPRLRAVLIGRSQLFREETLDKWILEVEGQCNTAR